VPTLSPPDERRPHRGRGRAEPIVAAYERGLVHHVGVLRKLEDQCCQWVPGVGNSPDRCDALVYGLTELLLQGASVGAGAPISLIRPSKWALRRAGGGYS
jgi:phage terminase large subunit-like protein